MKTRYIAFASIVVTFLVIATICRSSQDLAAKLGSGSSVVTPREATEFRRIRQGKSNLSLVEQKALVMDAARRIDADIDIPVEVLSHRLKAVRTAAEMRPIVAKLVEAAHMRQKMIAASKDPAPLPQSRARTGIRLQSPNHISSIQTTDGVDGLALKGIFLLAAARSEGLLIFDISDPRDVRRMAGMSLGYVNDVKVQGDYAFVVGGKRRLASGFFAVVDLNGTGGRSEVFRYKLPRGSNRITLTSQYAYVSDHGEGLFIFDVTAPQRPRLVSRFKREYDPSEYPEAARTTFLENHTWGTTTNQAETILYLCDDHAGLRIVDIADKSRPRQISRFMFNQGLSGFCNDVVVEDGLAYLAYDVAYLLVVDVSNPKRPRLIGQFNPNGGTNWKHAKHIAIRVLKKGTSVLVSQSRTGGVRVIDVSAPTRPVEREFFNASSSAWGLAVGDGLLHTGQLPIEGHKWGGIQIYRFE